MFYCGGAPDCTPHAVKGVRSGGEAVERLWKRAGGQEAGMPGVSCLRSSNRKRRIKKKKEGEQERRRRGGEEEAEVENC